VLGALVRIERANRAIGDLARRLQRVARTGSDPRGGAADLRQIVDDVVHLVQPLCTDSMIRINVEYGAMDRAWVAGDPTMIRQALANILLNAREAVLEVEPDRRFVDVRLKRTSQEVILSVRDGGRGIAPEVIRDLFKPFVTTKEGHAGLGLATAYASMKHFGGHVEVRNEPLGGACFELCFNPTAEAARRPSLPGPASQRKLRILLVDDEPDFVTTVREYLREIGHEVTACLSSEEALIQAGRLTFDVVLCDVGLPGRNGMDLLEMLRGPVPRGKMVLITGWDAESVRGDPRAARCDGILQKPFEASELGRFIGDLFGDRPAAWPDLPS
jgi:CheY-like chemotaxis protein